MPYRQIGETMTDTNRSQLAMAVRSAQEHVTRLTQARGTHWATLRSARVRLANAESRAQDAGYDPSSLIYWSDELREWRVSPAPAPRNHLLSRADILDAIARVHDYDTYPPADPTPSDGTYRIIPANGGNVAGRPRYIAQRITETSGYEVAYAEVIEGTYWYPLAECRFGYWRDSDTGVEYLDQTVHIRGNYNVAHTMGAHYNQLAIWNWNTNSVETTNAIEGI